MNLKDYAFPKVTDLDIAFSTFEAPEVLVKEAKERGFADVSNEYNKLFSTLFYSGGKIEFKKGVDEELKKKAWPFCRALMGSFAPKHEDKEAVCALIMSELLEAPQNI